MNFSVLLTKIYRYRLLLCFLLVCELQLLGEQIERGKCVRLCDKRRTNVHVPHAKLRCAVQFLNLPYHQTSVVICSKEDSVYEDGLQRHFGFTCTVYVPAEMETTNRTCVHVFCFAVIAALQAHQDLSTYLEITIPGFTTRK